MKGDFDRAKKLMKYDPVGITTFHIHQSSLLRTKPKKIHLLSTPFTFPLSDVHLHQDQHSRRLCHFSLAWQQVAEAAE